MYFQTWSITYHSWLTFVLLLGAIILWMVPNQRQSMLRVSPFLIFYAEFLLIIQFFCGMNLDLPENFFKYLEENQIGFSKSDFPVKDLVIKVRILQERKYYIFNGIFSYWKSLKTVKSDYNTIHDNETNLSRTNRCF